MYEIYLLNRALLVQFLFLKICSPFKSIWNLECGQSSIETFRGTRLEAYALSCENVMYFLYHCFGDVTSNHSPWSLSCYPGNFSSFSFYF